MEKNRILLIIVSVSLFLAAVLSVGLWFFYPRAKDKGAAPVAETNKTSTFDPIEWVRTKEEFPALTTKPSDGKQEDVIIVYGEDKSKKPADQPAEQKVVQPAPPKVQEPKAVQPAKTPSEKREIKPAKVQTKVKPVPVKEYLIQAGSFASRDRAEQAGKALKDKGMAGQIVSKDVNGTQFYRLRVGPYTNKAEAEKFLTWIRQIQGFENSLIFEGTRMKTVAN